MTVAQVSGAGLGGVLGTVLAGALQKYVGLTIDIGTAGGIVVSMMGWVGLVFHSVSTYGVVGLWQRFLHGGKA